ncbi:hypothetical protein, partial [Pedobacter sp.]|uniref:hypothetical protein n=1 Tax=Pedobacter sp. TaxID=1411316 RepID=UPI0031CEA2B8
EGLPEPNSAVPAFQKGDVICFWSAVPVQRSTFVPVLRYILSLRFRDAATPGAKNTGTAKNKVQIAIFLLLNASLANS